MLCLAIQNGVFTQETEGNFVFSLSAARGRLTATLLGSQSVALLCQYGQHLFSRC
jgi:hypothetical protein